MRDVPVRVSWVRLGPWLPVLGPTSRAWSRRSRGRVISFAERRTFHVKHRSYAPRELPNSLNGVVSLPPVYRRPEVVWSVRVGSPVHSIENRARRVSTSGA